MRWAPRILVGACSALLLCACSSDATSTTTTVPWKDYEPGLQAKIDSMTTARDCDGLQERFNQIGATNLAVRNRFGHGNVEILQYIDDREREANCFGTAPTTTT